MDTNQKPLEDILRERVSISLIPEPFTKKSCKKRRRTSDVETTFSPETPDTYQRPIDSILKERIKIMNSTKKQTMKVPNNKPRNPIPIPNKTTCNASTSTESSPNWEYLTIQGNRNNNMSITPLLESNLEQAPNENTTCSYWPFLVTLASIVFIVINDIILLKFTNLEWD